MMKMNPMKMMFNSYGPVFEAPCKGEEFEEAPHWGAA